MNVICITKTKVVMVVMILGSFNRWINYVMSNGSKLLCVDKGSVITLRPEQWVRSCTDL